MDIKAIMLVYKGIIEEPALLQEAEVYLQGFLEKDRNFCFKSCQILVSRKVDSQLGRDFRFYQGILLKNILSDNWESDPGVKFHQKVTSSHHHTTHHQPQNIRGILVKGIAVNKDNLKIVKCIVREF